MDNPHKTFCQSCAMPMETPEMFGTNSDGSRSEEYCTYCFQNGAFTEPDITMQDMTDKCVSFMVQDNILPEAKAREMMTQYLPALKRWKKA